MPSRMFLVRFTQPTRYVIKYQQFNTIKLLCNAANVKKPSEKKSAFSDDCVSDRLNTYADKLNKSSQIHKLSTRHNSTLRNGRISPFLSSIRSFSIDANNNYSRKTDPPVAESTSVESLPKNNEKPVLGRQVNLPADCKVIKVENSNEVQHIFQRFSVPKVVLNNYFALVAQEFQDQSLKAEPHFKSTQHKSEKPTWTCTYNIKWPINAKIVATATTKKKASELAASKTLDLLLELGKISPQGVPLIYTKDDVSRIRNEQLSTLKLDGYSSDNMRHIIELFNTKMKPLIEANDNEQNTELENEGDEVQDREHIRLKEVPSFLGSQAYLSKEAVELPISSYKEQFMDILRTSKCVIVKGEPGCGKSSRVPQYVLESWIRETESAQDLCRIAVTQPRRIAAISLADRVASERQEEVGHIVGYKVRLKSAFRAKTGRILYCTTGILLRHLQIDPTLMKFSHIILDEAHERDVNTDLLMNMLKKALSENDKLKLVVMSATIDAEKFSDYFDGAPILNVPGFTYPVQRYFLDELPVQCTKTHQASTMDNPQVIHEDVVKLINYIHSKRPEGAILVFLPGWEDLKKIRNELSFRRDMIVHLVHSKLKDSDQKKIFSRPPHGIRKVILATNIAETSITIDDVVYVIDTGIHKEKEFDAEKGVNVLDVDWISKANANQRAGRAGRCAPGTCYHLYTEEKFASLPDYAAPKILNSSLTKVVLDAKSYTNNMNACDFMNTLITPPESSAVKRAVDDLKQLQLLDENEKLTPLGKTLVSFQLEPSLGKAMVNSVVFKCVTPIVDIITLFSSETEFFGSLTLTDRETIRRIKSQFSTSSDHLALMRIFEAWDQLNSKDEEQFGESNRLCMNLHLVPHKLQFIKKLQNLHFDYLYNGLYDSVPVSDKYSSNEELVKAVLFSGAGTLLEHRTWDMVKNRLKKNTSVLVTRNNHKATITPDSVNFKRKKFPSNFMVYINETRSNIRRTTIVRECSLVPPISVVLFSNNELEIKESRNRDNQENMVILHVKNTKLKFFCDREEAETIINCKKAIDSSYNYIIYQLTCGGENISEFLQSWEEVLTYLTSILDAYKIEK